MLNKCLSSLILRLVALVSRWLGRPLHHYISFSRDRPFLALSFTGIGVKIEQLRLLQPGWNKELLGNSLPFQLHSALIECCCVRIGVFSGVTIEARGVYLLLKTTTNKCYNTDIEKKTTLDLKRKRLNQLHLKEVSSRRQPPPRWINRQLSKILNFTLFTLIKRAEVSVSDVHVRLEDELSHKNSSTAIGVRLQSLTLSNPECKKRAEVKCVSCYLNSGGNRELFTHSPQESATEKLQAFPFSDALGCDYVLNPTTLLGDVQLERGSHSYIHASLSLKCDSFKMHISEEQLKVFMELLGFIKQQQQFRSFLKFKPSACLSEKESIAKQRWLFAINCVLACVRAKRGRNIFSRLCLHRSLYKEYSGFFEKFLMDNGGMSRKMKLRMETIEREMDLLEIVACRSKVWRSLRLRRLFEDLSQYRLNDKKQSVSDNASELSLFSLSMAYKGKSIELLLTETSADQSAESVILKVDGSDLQLGMSHQPHLSSVKLVIGTFNISGCESDSDTNTTSSSSIGSSSSSSSSSNNVAQILYQPAASRKLLHGKPLDYKPLGHSPPGLAAKRQPIISAELTVSHTTQRGSESDLGTRTGRGGGGVFDHSVSLRLQQTVLRFDRKTALRLAAVGAMLTSSFNVNLKYYMKEQAHALKYQGEKKIKNVASSQETVSIDVDACLPLIVIPGVSDESSPSDIAIKLGNLELVTSVGDQQTPEKVVINYRAKLSGSLLAFGATSGGASSEVSMTDLFSSGSATKLLSFPKTKAEVRMTTNPLQDNASPCVNVNASVQTVEISISDGAMENLVLASSYHTDTLLQLTRVATGDGSRSLPLSHRRADVYDYLANMSDQLTDSRLEEVAGRINQHVPTLLSQQSLEAGQQGGRVKPLAVGVEQVDGGAKLKSRVVGKDLPVLHVTCNVKEVSLELTSEVRGLLNFLGGSVEGLCLRVEQQRRRGSLHCHLELQGLSLMDSSINAKGLEVRAPHPVLATQSNKNGEFFTADVYMEDPSSAVNMIRHHSAKNSVSVNVGALAVSLADASLLSWTQVFLNFYRQITTLQTDLQRLSHQFLDTTSPSPPVRAPSAMMLKRNKGIINLDARGNFAELTVSLLSGVVVITKLCISGIRAEVKDTMLSTELSASVDSLELLDCLHTYSKVVSSNSSERLAHLKVAYKKKVQAQAAGGGGAKQRTLVHTSSRPTMDPEALTANTRADITMGGLSCTVLFKFVSTLQGYFTSIAQNVSKHLETFYKSSKPALAAVDIKPMAPTVPFKCYLSVNIHTLCAKFPGIGGYSSEDFRIQLESFLLSNKYSSTIELSGAGGESYLPIIETAQLDFHQLSMARFDGEETFELVCVPDFGVSVTRFLSTGIPTQALLSEPLLKVTFTAEILEVYASNEDLLKVLLILKANFGDETSLVSFTDLEAESIAARLPESTEQGDEVGELSADDECLLPEAEETTVVFDDDSEERIEDVTVGGESEGGEGSEEGERSEGGEGSEEGEGGEGSEEEEGSEEGERSEGEEGVKEGRDILQLDANLKKLKWTLQYIESNHKSFPIPGKHLHMITELVLHDVFSLVDVEHDAGLHGELWVMDVTAKELPTNHGYSSLEREDAFILHQDLYHRKTRPPKLGGGTMDTRRASPADTILKTSFKYSQGALKVDVSVQHVHVCLWPNLISPFLALEWGKGGGEGGGGRGIDGGSNDGGQPLKGGKSRSVQRNDDDEATPFRVELLLGVNNTSIALLDKPSDLTSHGVCLEILSGRYSSMELVAGSSGVRFSCDSLHLEACVMKFGRKIAKLLPLLDPCSLSFSYELAEALTPEGKEETKEVIKMSASPIVISLSMETISTFIKPLSKAMAINETIHKHKVLVREPSKVKNLWEVHPISDEDLFPPGSGNISSSSNYSGRGGVRGGSTALPRVGEEEIVRRQRADVQFPSVSLNFDVVCAGYSSTLLSFTSALEAAATSWSTNVAMDATLELSGFVFNRRVASWEPLVEPLEDPLCSTYRSWGLVAKIRQVNSAASPLKSSLRDSTQGGEEGEEEEEMEEGAIPGSRKDSTPSEVLSDYMRRRASRNVVEAEKEMVLLLSSNQRLEMTLSPGAVETILNIVEATKQEEIILERNLAGCSYFSVQPMQIRNQTGLEIAIFPGPTFTLGNPLFSKRVTLSPLDATANPDDKGDTGPTVASGLAAVTMNFMGKATPSQGPLGAPDGMGGKKSVANLHYVNVATKKSQITDEIDQEEVVMEEWDDFLAHLKVSGHVGGKDMLPKATSLTKLRDILRRRKAASAESGWKKAPFQAFTKWRPREAGHTICIQAKGGKRSPPIAVTLPGLSPVPLYDISFGGPEYGKKLIGLCEVGQEDGVRVVTIRSSVQFKNEYPLSVTLYRHSEFGGAERLTVIQPGDTYNLPIPLFMEKTPLKIGIGKEGFFGEDLLDWSGLEFNKPFFLSCPAQLSSRRKKYHLQAVASSQAVTSELHLLNTAFHLISFKRTFAFHNLLPVALHVAERAGTAESDTVTLQPGETKSMHFVDPTKNQELAVEIPAYKGVRWTGILSVEGSDTSRSYSRVKLQGSNEKGDTLKMKFGVYSDETEPSLYRLYCPYWICNKSGLSLEYEYYSSKLHTVKGIVDDGGENSLTVVYFKPSVENKDKKLRVRVGHEGQLSKTIYLGNTGEAEEITAKAKDGTLYELSIQNSSPLHVLTRIIYILPKYVIRNSTELQVQISAFSEKAKAATEHRLPLEPGEGTAFWPSTHKACVIHFSSPGETQGKWTQVTTPFHLNRIGTISLPLTPGDPMLDVVTVKVSPGSSGSLTLVTIAPYIEGAAAYRLENHSKTGLALKIRQSTNTPELSIPAGHTRLYSWDNPLLSWQLHWQLLGEEYNSWTLIEDIFEGSRKEVVLPANDQSAEPRKVKVFWRTTYIGSQRVFQLFDDAARPEETKKRGERQAIQLSELTADKQQIRARGSRFEVICSMEGVGLSLLNNQPVEVLYCSIQSSPVVWLKRSKAGGKYREVEEGLQLELEGKWRTGIKEMNIDSEIFDLSSFKGNRGGTLMRSYHPGLWGSLSMMDSHFVLQAKIGRVQVDNQLEDYALDSRIVFAAEKVFSPELAVAPMVDAAVIIRRPNAQQRITVFEDAYLKVKSMQVNGELGMVAAIIPLLKPFLAIQGDSDLFTYAALDTAVKNPLLSEVSEVSKADLGSRFHNIAISPIKVAVTYTTIIAGPYDLSNELGNVLDSMVQISTAFANGTISVNLDAFKFTGENVDASELYTILYRHYRNEILSHIHSVVFGLDIIGNPSRLLGNIETGVRDLVDKSVEGFEHHSAVHSVGGVATGVKELLGHVVEGSTESLGSTAGSFRNTLLETTDLDYKRRHQRLEHSSDNLGSHLLLGTRFFVEGLVGGLTDIFRKPISGASTSGTKGFFQGLGKGALAILTKPALGTVDLAYFTLEGIRSFADSDAELQSVRLPRNVHPNMIITPYNAHEAQGLSILWHNQENSKGSQYYGHFWLPTEEGKDPRLILINSLNLLKLKRSGKSFKADDLCIKLEYMQDWRAITESDDTTLLLLKYGDDSKLEKLGLFLGFSKADHNAELINQTATVEVDSAKTGKFLVQKVTEACVGVLVHYARLMASLDK